MTLALKYRPTQFQDLVGQLSVSQTLSLALDQQKISNAYLFSGLRGSGKTSSARIFARALQCDNGPTSKPCGVCDNCKSSLEGRHIDIIELDAASNRKIDDIRDLIEQTKYKPSFGRYKIFIIDEVHMLTKEAFNALLKTLEEPPSFVKFILATTDPLLLPATILSRTQHFRFKKIPYKSVIEHITQILQKENIPFEEEALGIIARSGSGSLRDTLTLLEQAIIFGDNSINLQSVTEMLGIIDPQILENFFNAIIQKNDALAQKILETMQEYEAEMVLDEMLLYLKNLALSKQFNTTLLNRFFYILTQGKTLLSLNSDGEFVLLLSLLKMQEATKLKDIHSMISSMEKEVLTQSTQPAPLNQTSSTPIIQTPPQTQQDSPQVMQDLNQTSNPQHSPQESLLQSPTESTPTHSTSQILTESTLTQSPLIQDSNHPQTSQQSLSQAQDDGLFSPTSSDTTQNPPLQTSSTPSQNPAHQEPTTPPVDSIQVEQDLINQTEGIKSDSAFKTLIATLYDRNYALGECFEKNVLFVNFEHQTLTLTSLASDEKDKTLLREQFPLIKSFIYRIFGEGTSIKFQQPTQIPQNQNHLVQTPPQTQQDSPQVMQDLNQTSNPQHSPQESLLQSPIESTPTHSTSQTLTESTLAQSPLIQVSNHPQTSQQSLSQTQDDGLFSPTSSNTTQNPPLQTSSTPSQNPAHQEPTTPPANSAQIEQVLVNQTEGVKEKPNFATRHQKLLVQIHKHFQADLSTAKKL